MSYLNNSKNINKKVNTLGMTLIEVLIALSIISLALISTWRALNLTINNYANLQDSIITAIMAKNILVEASLKQQAINNKYTCVENLAFICDIKTKKTPNKYLYLVDVSIYKNNYSKQPLQHLVTILPYATNN